MSKIEYLILPIGVIIGYVITMFLDGWWKLYQNRHKIIFYTPHIIWTIIVFVGFIQFWWGFAYVVKFIEKDIFFYTATFALPVLWYFLVMMLFPKEYDDKEYLGSGGKYDLLIFSRKWRKPFYVVQLIYAIASVLILLRFYKLKDVRLQILFLLPGLLFIAYAIIETKKAEWVYIVMLILVTIFVIIYYIITLNFLGDFDLKG